MKAWQPDPLLGSAVEAIRDLHLPKTPLRCHGLLRISADFHRLLQTSIDHLMLPRTTGENSWPPLTTNAKVDDWWTTTDDQRLPAEHQRTTKDHHGLPQTTVDYLQLPWTTFTSLDDLLTTADHLWLLKICTPDNQSDLPLGIPTPPTLAWRFRSWTSASGSRFVLYTSGSGLPWNTLFQRCTCSGTVVPAFQDTLVPGQKYPPPWERQGVHLSRERSTHPHRRSQGEGVHLSLDESTKYCDMSLYSQ